MKISAKEKKILVLLLVIIVAVVLFMYVIRPGMAKVAELDEQYKALQAQDESYQTQINGQSTIDRDILHQIDKIDKAEGTVPPSVGTDGNDRMVMNTAFKEMGRKFQAYITSSLPSFYYNEIQSGTEKLVIGKDEEGKDILFDLPYWQYTWQVKCTTVQNINEIVAIIQGDKFWKVGDLKYSFTTNEDGVSEYSLSITARRYVESLPSKK